MFGLFGKKKKSAAPEASQVEEAKPAAPAPAAPFGEPPRPAGPVVTGVAGWRALCQQQHALLVAEVQAVLDGCRDEIAATQLDTTWIDRRFLPIDRKTEAARTLVRSTWNRTGDFEGEELALELRRAELELTLVREHAYRYVRAHAARAMMSFAPAHAVASGVARWVGEWDAFPLFVDVQRLEVQLDSVRDKSQVSLEQLRTYHQASHQYWSTVLVVEGTLAPERQQYIPMQLQALMTDANRRLSGFWQWREQ